MFSLVSCVYNKDLIFRPHIYSYNNTGVILALLVHIIIYVIMKAPLENPKNLSSFNRITLDRAEKTF